MAWEEVLGCCPWTCRDYACLMDMELKPDELEDVKGTLHYMIKNRYPSGNYPSSEGSESDRLVHWCHGTPGVALTLVKAAEVIFFFF